MRPETAPRPAKQGFLPENKLKILELRLEAAAFNLSNKIKRAFDIAKGSGRELDLNFSHKTMAGTVERGASKTSQATAGTFLLPRIIPTTKASRRRISFQRNTKQDYEDKHQGIF